MKIHLSVLAIFLVLAPVAADDMTLAKDGRTNYVVVTPAQASPEETTAAEWLADTLGRATGATFPIKAEDAPDLPTTRLLVGDTKASRDAGIDRARLAPEQWRIKTDGDTIVLAGGRPRGTIYSVVEFLETHVGVLMLDPFTEVLPSRPTLSVGELDRTGQPAFAARLFFTGFPYRDPADGGRLIERFRFWNRNNLDGRVATGDYERFVPVGVHTFGYFISSKEFAAEHPEYFGMDKDGKRVTDDRGSPQLWTQLCVTNPEVRRIVVERARKFLLDDREAARKEGREPARWLVLSQNDNTSNLCQCPECKAVSDREGSESGANVEFANHVARELKAEFPDVRFQTEAYNFTLKAPKDVRPDDNVVVRFCDNYGFSDFTRPLAAPGNERPMGLFRGWQEKNCRLGVWDYWRNFQQHPPGMFAPSTNVRAMVQDLRMFRDAGVDMVTVECEDLFGAGVVDDPTSADMPSFAPLRTWVGLKLLDDPKRELDPLLDKFCQGYYGPAAQPMRKLLDLIEDRQVKSTIRLVDVQRQTWLAEICDGEFFATAYSLLDAASKATVDDPAHRVHVQRERIVVDSAFLWTEGLVREQAGAKGKSWPARDKILARHRDDWKAYLPTVFDENGQKLAWPIIESGITLLERLRPDDIEVERVAVAVTEKSMKLDGKLDEPFWRMASPARLLPRDPAQPNDSATTYRFAWTSDALWVAVEQPTEAAASSIGFAIHDAERKEIQLGLYAPKRTGEVPLNAYPYEYDADNYLKIVKDRKIASQAMSHEAAGKTTLELRLPWSDLAKSTKTARPIDTKRRFVMNVESYATPESKAPEHVGSPWLVGRSPTWHSGYFQSLRLAPR